MLRMLDWACPPLVKNRPLRRFAGCTFLVSGLCLLQADHSDRESSVNSMAFIAGGENSDGAQLLATGGEDGVLRVWELSADRNGATAALGNDTGAINSDGGEEHRAASLEVTQLCECEGHSKSITCVRIHSSGEVVLTASKDGTCRLWDWRRNSQAALLATTSGLPASVLAPQVMCRACCFAPHRPDLIYSVQSGPRGKAYVTEWKYRIEEGRREKPSGAMNGGGDGLEGVITCAVEPSKVKYVSPHPATTMSVRQDGARLAVGNVEGTVLVYRLPGFAKVMEYPAHDLPVTGLAFAPGDTGVALGGFDLLAGSADYKITLFKTQGSAVKLACGQVLRGLWWLVVMVITSILFILRAIVSIIMTVIPLMGLCAIGAAVYYYPTSLRDVAISFYDEIAVELGWEPMSVVGEDREPEERVPLVG